MRRPSPTHGKTDPKIKRKDTVSRMFPRECGDVLSRYASAEFVAVLEEDRVRGVRVTVRV